MKTTKQLNKTVRRLKRKLKNSRDNAGMWKFLFFLSGFLHVFSFINLIIWNCIL